MGAALVGQPTPEEPVTVIAFAVMHQTRYLQSVHISHTHTHTRTEGKNEKQ